VVATDSDRNIHPRPQPAEREPPAQPWADMDWYISPAPHRRGAAAQLGLVITILAGGLIGFGVSALFGFLLFEPALVSILRVRLGWNLSSDALGPWSVPLAIVSTLAAGSAFGSIVGAARGAGSRRRSALVGVTLMLASMGGFFFAAAFEEVGMRQPDSTRLLLFRVAFVGASCLVALVSMAVAARVFALEHALRRTLLVVAITGATYLTVAVGVDVIPGWHVGGGDRAMLRVATAANLVAGWVGGAVACALLIRHRIQLSSPGR
jgi:hypothetical protein